MNFHKKYKRVTPWWRPITAEFLLLKSHSEFTGIFNYEYEDKYVQITKNGVITAKAGFRWSASGPTWDTKSSRRASCIHDCLYYLSQKGVFNIADSDRLKRLADNLLYSIAIADGMWLCRATAWYKALDAHGHKAWNKRL